MKDASELQSVEDLIAEVARLKVERNELIDRLAEEKANTILAKTTPRSHPRSLHRLAEIEREEGFLAAFWPFMIVPGLMLLLFLFAVFSYYAYSWGWIK